MSGGRIVIHYNDTHELFDNDDFKIITVDDLLKRIQHRIYGNNEELNAIFGDYLCEGPYASQPLTDVRLREIIEMVHQLMALDSINEESEKGQRPVELWLCNYTNNLFLFENSSTTGEQHSSGNTRTAGNNANSNGMHFQTNYTESSIPQPPCTEMDSVQNNLSQHTDDTLDQLLEHADDYLKSLEKPSESCNTSNESSNENVLKFTNDFRKYPKEQYRSDVFPLKKNKKVKKNKLTNKKTTSQTTNKKRKIYKKNKKYAFHLQAVKFQKGCTGGRYPRVQLPRHYLDLIQKGQVVSVFIAATKRINGHRCLDALKGFLIDKKNLKIPLENPCIINFKWTDRKKPPPKDYPLKLALIQVSGDKNRKCKREYNEKFDFGQRIVDETSKYSDYDDDTDEPEEFQITVVPVKGDALLEADWPILIDSNLMHYVNRKSNKKQKTNSSVAGSSSIQEQLQTRQENEEDEQEYDDDDEEDDDNNNDEE